MPKKSILTMIVLILTFGALLFACAAPTPAPAPAPETVVFPDKNLEEAIRTALDKPAGEAITPAELAGLTVLPARELPLELRITDLSGIEYCTNLTELDLDFNRISDLSPSEELSIILARRDMVNN